MTDKKRQAGAFIGHFACPDCSSTDNLAVYQKVIEEDNHPFEKYAKEDDEGNKVYFDASCMSPSCKEHKNGWKSPEWLEENDILDPSQVKKVKHKAPFRMTDEIMEDIIEISELSTYGWPLRGILKETEEFYGVKTRPVEDEDGKMVVGYRYYPSRTRGQLSGYHVRNVRLKTARKKAKAAGLPKPKGAPFFPIGYVKTDSELFGQHLFNKGGRHLIITAGEEDCLAAYQAVEAEKYGTAVVSPTIGEANAYLQVKENYEWVSSFEKVTIVFDDDEAGNAGAEAIAKLLKPSQAFIAKLPNGDCCDYLARERSQQKKDGITPDGKSSKLKTHILWEAEQYSPAGIIGSSQTLNQMKERASFVKVALPAFAEELEKMLNGGFALGEITTIAAACVDNETEFLTDKGWKKISEYEEGDLVTEYDPNSRSITKKKPVNYIKAPCGTLYHFKNTRMDQVVSPNHRMPYLTYNGSIKIETAQWIKDNHEANATGFRGKFITTFNNEGGEGIGLSEGELRLSVAVKADGRVVKGGKDNYTQMRFKKERKYRRLLEMCEKFNLRHDDRGWYESEQTYQVIVWPECAEKSYNSWWNASKRDMEIIADEVLYWDGTQIHSDVFFGKRKEDADFIQYVFASLGRRSSVWMGANVWETSLADNSSVGISAGASGKRVIEEYKDHDGYQYCFETTTGMWVARRNGKIFVTGNSSIGKTSIVNEFLYHFVMNSPYKVGVISLESDVGELTENLLSVHIGKKLSNMNDEEKLEYYDSDEAINAHRELTSTPDGRDRYYILDHQGAVVDQSLMEKIEYLVKGLDCKVIVLDPLTLALSGKQNDGMDLFMSELLRFVKREKIHHINVVHVRKNGGGMKANSTGATIHEEDIKGSGSIFQVSMNNILLMRDKENPDPIIRNTTKVVMSKARRTGNTGPAGYWLYNNETARLTKGKDPEGNYMDDEELFAELKAYEEDNLDNLIGMME